MNIKAWIHPALYNWLRLLLVVNWCGMRCSWHTLSYLATVRHQLRPTAYWNIVAKHVHPFMTHLLMVTSSRIGCHLRA